MYKPDQWEILSEICSVACITAVSLIFGRKVAGIDGPVYYVRGLLMVLYSLAWAFDMIACMLVSTNNGNYISCILGFYNIVLIYMAAKVCLLLYFLEKVYVCSAPKTQRFQSWLYWVGLGLMVPYIAFIILMILNRVTEVEQSAPYHCEIGYTLEGSIPILCYDFLILLFTTLVFVKFYAYPSTAQQTAQQASSLKIMAYRNIIGASVACLTATVNYVVMVILDGNERGLVAMSICTLDITIVSCVIHWVTSHTAELQFVERAMQKAHNEKALKLEIKQHQEVVVLHELNSHRT